MRISEITSKAVKAARHKVAEQPKQVQFQSPVQQAQAARVSKTARAAVDTLVSQVRNGGALLAKAAAIAKPLSYYEPLKPVEGAKTIDDFHLIGASPQHREEFSTMLVYLQQANPDGTAVSPTAVELLAQLPPGTKVFISYAHNSNYNAENNTITWNPYQGQTEQLNPQSEAVIVSPSLVFAQIADNALLDAQTGSPGPVGEYSSTDSAIAFELEEPFPLGDFPRPTVVVDFPDEHTPVVFPPPDFEVVVMVPEEERRHDPRQSENVPPAGFPVL